jgi:Ubiquitin carboxyl-terminal hydrolase, family 1
VCVVSPGLSRCSNAVSPSTFTSSLVNSPTLFPDLFLSLSPHWTLSTFSTMTRQRTPSCTHSTPSPTNLHLTLCRPTLSPQTKAGLQRSMIDVRPAVDPAHSSPYFVYQVDQLQNACGTLAVIHALLNLKCTPLLHAHCALVRYAGENLRQTPRQRGLALSMHTQLNACHRLAVQRQAHESKYEESDSEEEDVDHHFITLLLDERRLCVLEMDARDPAGPRSHPLCAISGDQQASGVVRSSALLSAAIQVIQLEYLQKHVSRHFAVLAVQMV